MIAEATNHGSMWQAMGASHYTTDDVLWGQLSKTTNGREGVDEEEGGGIGKQQYYARGCTILVQAQAVENYNIQELKVLL